MTKRTSIYKNNVFTIRFKNQWENFTIFKEKMLEYEVDETYLVEKDFKLIQGLISLAFLISNNVEKNNAIAALNYSTMYETYLKQKTWYDTTIQDLQKSKSEIENKLYSVNSTKSQVLEENYLDGGTKSTINNEKLLLEDLDQIEKRMKTLINPYKVFIMGFTKSIISGFQPQTDQNNFGTEQGEY